MRTTKLVSLALAAALALTLWGCGSNRDSSGSTTTGDTNLGSDPVTSVAYVGAGTCIGCHEGFSWSKDAVDKYLVGKHVVHSTHVEATSEALCLSCHDPIGDGGTIEGLIDPADVPADGLAAVGCENCHGAGGEHYGVGPIPNATPDFNACGQCHNSRWTTEMPSHITYHPEGNNILADYVASPHTKIHTGAPCAKCHTDEGARQYKDYDTFESLVTVTEVENPSPIQCRTCHDPHNPGKLLEDEQTSGRGASLKVVASAEYATCTNCHQRHDAQVGASITNLPGSSSSDGASGDLIYHAARYSRVISSTHYDNPATTDVVEGYTMDPANERSCRDCHNVHAADITINEQWAESGHGGDIIAIKEAAVAAAGFDDHDWESVAIYRAAGVAAADNAFVHYDWDAENRQSCQQCHTSTGFKNYATDPATYDAANNDFSHLVGWSKDVTTGVITPSGQNEMLYCWACHSNNAGGLRVKAAVTAGYTYNSLPIDFPDVGSSNTCLVCHSARGNASDIPVSTSGYGASHHGIAGAILFSNLTHVGGEYVGQDYSKPSYFAHDILGTPADAATGNTDAGPCAVCHMNAAAGQPDHTFAVVEKDAAGVVVGLKSEACINCHTGAHGAALTTTDLVAGDGTAAAAAAFLEEESLGYQEAGQLLKDTLNQANGQTNYTGGVVAASSGTDNDHRAFQNSLIPGNDAGGYAHNRYYVKRLLFDSIDWLDNAVLDGSITIDVALYPEAVAWLGGDAVTGVTNRP